MNKKQKMYEMIEKHGADLNEIFKTSYNDITLAKKLMRLEVKAHQQATDMCNGDCDDVDDAILDKVNKLLSNKDVPIFHNLDCRGYALKIDDEWVKEHNLTIYKDWGGYGILAPDFRNEV